MTVDNKTAAPLFGTLTAGRTYAGRLGAYGIARSVEGLIAAVEGDSGRLYFPGGGALLGEPVTVALELEREAQEECGWTVTVEQQLGRAFPPSSSSTPRTKAMFFWTPVTSGLPAIDPVIGSRTHRALGRVAFREGLRRADASRLRSLVNPSQARR